MEVCNITIRHKENHKLCRFFVVPGDSPAVSGIPEIEIVGILSVKCNTIEPRRHIQEINEQHIEEKSCTNKNSNGNPTVNCKNIYRRHIQENR